MSLSSCGFFVIVGEGVAENFSLLLNSNSTKSHSRQISIRMLSILAIQMWKTKSTILRLVVSLLPNTGTSSLHLPKLQTVRDRGGIDRVKEDGANDVRDIQIHTNVYGVEQRIFAAIYNG